MTYKTDPPLNKWLIDLRREIHKHPEPALQETRTTRTIVRTLEFLGVNVVTLPDLTGAVGLIRGSKDGPTIGLRADIDALPIQETNPVEYKSQNSGYMHACGHDANTAIMLGVAKKIIDTDLAKEMRGNVKFLFQPAEEQADGAKKMIAKGVLEKPYVNHVIAGHMEPNLAVGQIGVFRNTGYASSDAFKLVIHGKGGHSARPEKCIDPIIAGAFFTTQIQSIISRNKRAADAAVVTIGAFRAGTIGNVIPETATLEGTIRALHEDVRNHIIDRLKEMTDGLEKTFKVKCEFEIGDGTPVLVNDKSVSELLFEASVSVLGRKNVSWQTPIMGSEDFAFFCLERPSAIIRFGCSNGAKGIVHPLHSPKFDIDETVLEIGVDIFYEALQRFLA